MRDLNRNEIWTAVVLGAAFALAPAMQAQQGYDPNYPQQGYTDPNAGQADPPSRVARVSVVVGNVSIEPASIQQFNEAETNYPMTTGDRIYADAGANAEIQTGQLAVRLGQQTDLTVTAMTDALAQFGLAQGSVHLRSYNVYQGEAVEVDTPNVAVSVLQAGDVRVDVNAASGSTVVTVFSGQAQVNGNGVEEVLEPGERLLLNGSNPVYAQAVGGARMDGLDRFSQQRDSLFLSAFAADGQYLNPGTIGAEDLNAYGSWNEDGDYGAVWFPANVDAGWQPYQNGHWTWVAPWGWTWIEAEPWGFAPFHYGRWARFGPRWGWIPGPVVVRPVYSPALVVFVGGGGVSAWFPLGPGEVYHPWYHSSPLYLNRVNVSNIYNRNVVEVRNVYNQRTVVNNYVNVDNRTYLNRQVATVAVRQDAFAAGRPVAQARVDARQLSAAPVLPHPLITPERGMVAGTPARAVPPVQQRPVLASHEDTAVRPVNGVSRWNTMQPQPGQPQVQLQQGLQQGQRGGGFQQPPSQPQQPQRGQPQPPVQQPASQRPQPQTPVQQPTPSRPVPQPVQQPVQVQQPAQQVRGGFQTSMPPRATSETETHTAPQQQPATLFNKAVPPEPRPSFEQQRQAIQQNDPGRPLSPQQLNNVRQNQPAGPAEQKEPQHPQPQPVAPPVAPRGIPMKPNGPVR